MPKSKKHTLKQSRQSRKKKHQKERKILKTKKEKTEKKQKSKKIISYKPTIEVTYGKKGRRIL